MATGVAVPETHWDAAISAIHAAPDVVLVCHVAPDGDALGSMLALAGALRRMGKRVDCTWGDDPWQPPASYRWLPGLDTAVPPSEAGPDPALLVVLDTASRDRMGVLAPLADRAGTTVVIDHHAHNSGIEGIQLVDDGAAATAVITAELLRRLDAVLDADMATQLYVGLVTDTGSFQHPVTTPAVHALAGRLVDAGAQPAWVAEQLWGRRPFGFLVVVGAALGRVRLEPDAIDGNGLVWTWTARDDLAAASIGLDEAEAVIDVVRTAREADVAVVCKQDTDGSFRVSTRSRGGVDVGAACIRLGGGGHRMAAGFTSYDDVHTTMERLRGALTDVVRSERRAG